MTEPTAEHGAPATGNADSPPTNGNGAATNGASAAAAERAARLREQRAKAGRPATAARTLAAGISGTAMFGLIAAMGAAAPDNPGYVPPVTAISALPATDVVSASAQRTSRAANAAARAKNAGQKKPNRRAVPRTTVATTTIPVATTIPPTLPPAPAVPVATTRQSS